MSPQSAPAAHRVSGLSTARGSHQNVATWRHFSRHSAGQSEARPKNAEELQLGSWPAMIFLHLMVIYGCCNIKRLSTSSTIEM
jgi:hypothetical protein